MEDKQTTIETVLNYIAGIFACIGMGAIIYKLYLFGFTRDNITDATINLAQLLTTTSIIILGVQAIIKDNHMRAKNKFIKELERWTDKYCGLTRVKEQDDEDDESEDDEKIKEIKKKNQKFKQCLMLADHSNLIKKNDEIRNIKEGLYVKFAKIPIDNFSGNRITFYFKEKTVFKKLASAELSNLKQIIIKRLLKEFNDIIEEIKENKKQTVLRLELKLNLKSNANTYQRIFELLDYMTMVYLAVA